MPTGRADCPQSAVRRPFTRPRAGRRSEDTAPYLTQSRHQQNLRSQSSDALRGQTAVERARQRMLGTRMPVDKDHTGLLRVPEMRGGLVGIGADVIELLKHGMDRGSGRVAVVTV